MKHIICAVFVLLLWASGYSQQASAGYGQTYQDDLQKSKNQKFLAWLLLGGGTAMSAGAVAWAAQDIFGPDEGEGALFVAGVCTMLGSIPLFIASARNKRMAYGINFQLKFEKSTVLQQTRPANFNYPALSLSVKL